MKSNILFGALPESTSPAGSVNWLDIKKTLRHLIVVAAGALVTEGFNLLSTYVTGHDFGQYAVIVSLVVSSGLLELVRRWVSDALVEVDN